MYRVKRGIKAVKTFEINKSFNFFIYFILLSINIIKIVIKNFAVCSLMCLQLCLLQFVVYTVKRSGNCGFGYFYLVFVDNKGTVWINSFSYCNFAVSFGPEVSVDIFLFVFESFYFFLYFCQPVKELIVHFNIIRRQLLPGSIG